MTIHTDRIWDRCQPIRLNPLWTTVARVSGADRPGRPSW